MKSERDSTFVLSEADYCLRVPIGVEVRAQTQGVRTPPHSSRGEKIAALEIRLEQQRLFCGRVC